MLSDRCGGQDHNGWLLKTDLCGSGRRAQRGDSSVKALALQGPRLSPHRRQEGGGEAEFCKADFASVICASIFKEAELLLTSKAGGLRAACGFRPHGQMLAWKAQLSGWETLFSEFSRCALIWGYLPVELQEQKTRRRLQDPKHDWPHREGENNRAWPQTEEVAPCRGPFTEQGWGPSPLCVLKARGF